MKKAIFAFLVSFVSYLVLAAAPTSFFYQGVLRAGDGSVLKADMAVVTFRLYDVATGGTALWTGDKTVSLDSTGLFCVELDGGATFDKVVADAEKSGKSLYWGVTVKDSAGEIQPRQKMVPALTAVLARNVTAAQGDFQAAQSVEVAGGITMSGTNVLSTGSIEVQGSELRVKGNAAFNGDMNVDSTNGMTVVGACTVNNVVPTVPRGTIIMWSGDEADIPTGWRLCNVESNLVIKGETLHIPDLTGRFIVGADTNRSEYTVGNTGGVAQVTLDVAHLPQHRHEYANDDEPWKDMQDGKKKVVGNVINRVKDQVYGFDFSDGSGGTKGTLYETPKTGGDKNGNTVPHENRPPYYALCFIIKVD